MTEQQNEIWNSFYRETEPERRREIWRQYHTESREDMLRGQLLEKRFPEKKPGDQYMWLCMNLMEIGKSGAIRAKILSGNIKKQLRELGIQEFMQGDDVQKEFLYQEIRNAGSRYLASCNGREYGRKWFGIGNMKPEELQEKILGDICAMSDEAAAKLGMEEELSLWCRAIRDAYADFAGE